VPTDVMKSASSPTSSQTPPPIPHPPAPARPDRDPLAELRPIEALHMRVARRMNGPRWKAFSSFWSKHINARLILSMVSRQLHVEGFEHVRRASLDRPILLVANHRSYFDMYVVSSLLLMRLPRSLRIYFPVRARYFYETAGGLVVNGLMGHFSMYPPIFGTAERKHFDRYAVDLLTELCREGPGNVIGIHPEGTRNKGPDPYSQLKAQPGTGRIIHAARPQVFPVFVAGLGNNPLRMIGDGFRARGRRAVRVRFGEMLDLAPFEDLPAKGSTYKIITEHVMALVRRLGEEDRKAFGGAGTRAHASGGVK
jgi:1-acyl-sn-glycerol-3-phosphate acyltransferase